MKNFEINKSHIRCKLFRKKILETSQKVSALHLGGSFSCVEIMDLIFNTLNKKKFNNFIMSKGHASIIHYIILEHLNVLKKKDLENYTKKKGILGVHPDIGNPGINASTGSLGHGLGLTAGMALAEKKEKFYVIISDGELQEGSTWEAIMLIPSLKLKNVILFVDNNDFQSSERISKAHANLYPLENKFRSFGWQSESCNGHDVQKMYRIVKKKNPNKCLAIIAKTKKGYPISFMMDNPIWHYRSPSKKELSNCLLELEK